MIGNDGLAEFPGTLVPFAPSDNDVQTARNSSLRMASGYQGLPRSALIGGLVLAIVLVVFINESLIKAVGGVATVAALTLAGLGQLIIGWAAERKGLAKIVGLNEDVSLTVMLVIIVLGSLAAVLPHVDQGRYFLAGGIAITVYAVFGALIGQICISRYLFRKKIVIEYLKGFEHAPTETLDDLWSEAAENVALDDWMRQIKYRQEPLTLHEASAIRRQFLGGYCAGSNAKAA